MDDDASAVAGLLPPRTPWSPSFPPVFIHTTVQARDAHPLYLDAKQGDAGVALALALGLLDPSTVTTLKRQVGAESAVLLPITALEVAGFNAIPDAMAHVLGEALGWPVSTGAIVQNNKVGHTRAPAFNRLVTPAVFEGFVETGVRYVLVDDHVGLGGTLANLKGYVESRGAKVIAMTTLTESREARHIALRAFTLNRLRAQHGEELEDLWSGQIGHGLDRLTDIEAQLLCREPTVASIRDRLAQAAVEVRSRGLRPAVRGAP